MNLKEDIRNNVKLLSELNLDTPIISAIKTKMENVPTIQNCCVGGRIEADIVNDLNSPPFLVRQPGAKGYPDTEILFENETVYMELKATGIIEESRYRHFYYTSGSKIKSAARHILLIILAESQDRGYWAVRSFIISDLSKLKVKLKAEFNASKSDLIKDEARILSIP